MAIAILRVLLAVVVVGVAGAQAQTEVVEYYATDAIGSIRVVFDPAGTVKARADYLPFGEDWQPSNGLPTQRFTGQQRDAEENQDYFGARSYVPRSGRFTTVDPVFSALFQPQAWNRYAYALNNPLTFVDPTGLSAEAQPASGCSGWQDKDVYRFDCNKKGGAGEGGGGGGDRSGPVTPSDIWNWVSFGGPSPVTGAGGFRFDDDRSRSGAPSLAEVVTELKDLTSSVDIVDAGMMVVAVVGPLGVIGPLGEAGIAGRAALTVQSAERAAEIHRVLHPIAFTHRTTAVLETTGGRVVANSSGLNPAQRALLRPGEIAVQLPGAHAEMAALNAARELGVKPIAISVTRTFCPACAAVIEKAGGIISKAERSAIWPK